MSTRKFGIGHRTTRNTNRGSAHCFAAGYSDNIVRPPHPPTKPCDLVRFWKWTEISSTGPIEQSRRALGQRMRKPSCVHKCLNKAGCRQNLERGLFKQTWTAQSLEQGCLKHAKGCGLERTKVALKLACCFSFIYMYIYIYICGIIFNLRTINCKSTNKNSIYDDRISIV